MLVGCRGWLLARRCRPYVSKDTEREAVRKAMAGQPKAARSGTKGLHMDAGGRCVAT
jgi:hypothetical protein